MPFTTKIIRQKRKTLALTIAPDSTVVVKAPKFTPMFFINSFIKQNEEWIKKQMVLIRERRPATEKKYQTGDTFLFLGIERTLQLGNFAEVLLRDNTILFPQLLQFRAQKQLMEWYKKQAKEIITKQVEYYAQEMTVSYKSLKFSDTKSQWGSCTRDNQLQFSWRLVMTPILVVNYVVVHELAHTIEKNHSRDFWRIVRAYCPSYQRQRNWLKKYGNTLTI